MRYLFLLVLLFSACTKVDEKPVIIVDASSTKQVEPAPPKMDIPSKAFEILVDLEGMESIPYQDGNGRSVGYDLL
tara:strand:- start:149 stop:373 length:225 start_codon:yes stop_codon:yes gene_type:complete